MPVTVDLCPFAVGCKIVYSAWAGLLTYSGFNGLPIRRSGQWFKEC
jgi:hypothetical protein